MALIFYDFEVFKYNWILLTCDPFSTKEKWTLVKSKKGLEEYYSEHKNDIWVGYNSRSYDTYILKAILLGFDPYEVSNWIINLGMQGWKYSSELNKIQLLNYDVMSSKAYGLKTLEGFMGNDMKESSVPFNLDREWTDDEFLEVVKYCKHDVEQTMEVFLRQKADFDAHMSMIKTFNLPMSSISKTQAQLSAMALGCVKKDWWDEWEYSIVDTLRIKKYEQVIMWFEEQRQLKNYEATFTINVAGVPHQFGWGGLHGAPDEPIHKKGLLLHVDVTSFYPSIMIRYDMLSRNVSDKSVYKKIYDKRVELKKAGKKKEQAPYKIILNSTYGISKDKYSNAYDPRKANEVCVNGQLLLLDLIEHLEGHCELIQSNTDGLIIQIEDTDEAFDKIDDICFEWESRTGMHLGFDVITEIWQKDVNNYIFKFENGEIERKGAYVKELNDLDNDLPIINTALVERMVNGVPVEKTINECDELKQFQKIVKVTSKYKCGWHNGKPLSEKTFRVFASTNKNDTYIGKQKSEGATIEKFANTPEHCFIYNGDVNEMKVPNNLDRQYYIDLANKRLEQFGM